MKLGNQISVIATAIVMSTSIVAIRSAASQPSDYELLAEMKASENRAPEMEYPKSDLRGRAVPGFDYLVVLTSCHSCSQFREKIRPFMNSKPSLKWLIAAPDMVGNQDLLKQENYYVVPVKDGSPLSLIAPGVYKR